MTARVVLSPEAQDDSDAIIVGFARRAGLEVARRYARDFDRLYSLLADHPDIGPGRPRLGEGVRISVVALFVVIYAHDGTTQTATVLRIVHGKRRITRRLLRNTVR